MATATATATIIASQTLPFQNPSLHRRHALNHTTLYLRRHQTPTPSAKLRPFNLRPSPKPLRISASSSSQFPSLEPGSNGVQPNIADSTRTISAILALAASASAAVLTTIRNLALKIKSLCIAPTPDEMGSLQSLQETLVCTVGPMFFAALRSRPSGALNTPLTVVAAGLSKWLDIYSGVLLVRVLLSWFPNIPWDRQPLSAIRDLCDPYLNLFRNIIPPVFDTLDVSPLLAFAVLGALGSLLNNSRGV
uniref:YGGT family protein n=1 Tax=Kalanchoe fedtschenkoi TaxID=63787 RepID=A0A7N0ZZP0_KALFE